MTWIGPAILFFGCVAGAAVLSFCMVAAWADRMIESWHERRQEDER